MASLYFNIDDPSKETYICRSAGELLEMRREAHLRRTKTLAVVNPTRAMLGFKEFLQPGQDSRVTEVTYLIGLARLRDSMSELSGPLQTLITTRRGRELIFGRALDASVPSPDSLSTVAPVIAASNIFDPEEFGDLFPDVVPSPKRRLAKKGDKGNWVEKRTGEDTRVRITQDQGKGDKKVHVTPTKAPKGAPSKPVPAKELTLDKSDDD